MTFSDNLIKELIFISLPEKYRHMEKLINLSNKIVFENRKWEGGDILAWLERCNWREFCEPEKKGETLSIITVKERDILKENADFTKLRLIQEIMRSNVIKEKSSLPRNCKNNEMQRNSK